MSDGRGGSCQQDLREASEAEALAQMTLEDAQAAVSRSGTLSPKGSTKSKAGGKEDSPSSSPSAKAKDAKRGGFFRRSTKKNKGTAPSAEAEAVPATAADAKSPAQSPTPTRAAAEREAGPAKPPHVVSFNEVVTVSADGPAAAAVDDRALVQDSSSPAYFDMSASDLLWRNALTHFELILNVCEAASNFVNADDLAQAFFYGFQCSGLIESCVDVLLLRELERVWGPGVGGARLSARDATERITNKTIVAFSNHVACAFLRSTLTQPLLRVMVLIREQLARDRTNEEDAQQMRHVCIIQCSQIILDALMHAKSSIPPSFHRVFQRLVPVVKLKWPDSPPVCGGVVRNRSRVQHARCSQKWR